MRRRDAFSVGRLESHNPSGMVTSTMKGEEVGMSVPRRRVLHQAAVAGLVTLSGRSVFAQNSKQQGPLKTLDIRGATSQGAMNVHLERSGAGNDKIIRIEGSVGEIRFKRKMELHAREAIIQHVEGDMDVTFKATETRDPKVGLLTVTIRGKPPVEYRINIPQFGRTDDINMALVDRNGPRFDLKEYTKLKVSSDEVKRRFGNDPKKDFFSEPVIRRVGFVAIIDWIGRIFDYIGCIFGFC